MAPRLASQVEEARVSRRVFLGGMLGVLLSPLARVPGAAASQTPGPALPAAVTRALASSPYVYISPLRAEGGESRCHGEVWFGWIDGAVVVITRDSTWKARSAARGLDRARIWVGDYGRWKQSLGGHNERFREGPGFEARARQVRDGALLDRLLAIFDQKYPDEIGKWRPRMESGFADGSRVLIRYEPERATASSVRPPAGESP